MSILSKIVRTAIVGVVAAVAIGATAVPASAAFGFDLKTLPGNGSAEARGTISFTDKEVVRIKSTVWDLCPADGYGAYLRYEVTFGDGSVLREHVWDAFNRHTSGCDDVGHFKDRSFAFGKNIKKVRLVLSEYDADQNFIHANDFSEWKVNPHYCC